MRTQNKNKMMDGFTLIELLVVIAIIALLMAIITPALRKAKEHARTVVCKSNLKQYALGMVSYLQENDGTFPYPSEAIYTTKVASYYPCQWHNKEASPEKNIASAGPLWPYLSNMAGHLCPSFKNFANKYGEDHLNHDSGIAINPQYSYSQNAYLGSDMGTIKESGINRSSAEVALFVEETLWQMQSNDGKMVATHVLNDTVFLARHPADSFGQAGDSIGTYHKNVNVEMSLRGSGSSVMQESETGEGSVVFYDGHIELVNPFEYQEGQSSYCRFYKSYLISYPKRNAMDNECPY